MTKSYNSPDDDAAQEQTDKQEQEGIKKDDVKPTFQDVLNDFSEEKFEKYITQKCLGLVELESLKDYNVVFLYDHWTSIRDFHVKKLYSALKTFKNEKKKVLLILASYGGEIEPAYQISKVCSHYASDEFSVAVTGNAKSAATLICLGSDYIHMGLIGQLGPIDPQTEDGPALSVKQGLNILVDIAKEKNDMTCAMMLGDLLKSQLKVKEIGYYDRVISSAAQYAEKLLLLRNKTADADSLKRIKDVSAKLVYEYKDHGFVIDQLEAKEVLGDKIKTDTQWLPEVEEIVTTLDQINFMFERRHQIRFAVIGNADDIFIQRVKKAKNSTGS